MPRGLRNAFKDLYTVTTVTTITTEKASFS